MRDWQEGAPVEGVMPTESMTPAAGASRMAKQYLYGYLALKRRRSALMEEWEQARQVATRATSRVTAVRVSGTGRKDGMANAVLRSVEIEERLKRLVDHLAEAMDARIWMIEQIPDEWEKTVLTQRYICGKRWEEIAANLPFEIAQVYRIHGRALQSFWRVYAQVKNKAEQSKEEL